MADVDRQLVQQIADEVMAALAERMAGAASVRPPIGACTGDYSKFPELRGRRTADPAPSGARTVGSESPARTGGVNGVEPTPGPRPLPAQPANPAPPLLTGFVTARQLESLTTDTVRLAPDARLTPLAQDCIKERKLEVQRVVSHSSGQAVPIAQPRGRWLWWSEGRCPAADNITEQWRQVLTRPNVGDSAHAVREVVTDLNAGVRAGRFSGGILLVKCGAKSACYANRCGHLRAILGTCDEAVREGIRSLAANVLIVEYPHQSPNAIRAMVERFVTTPRPRLPQVVRDLQEVGR